MSQTKEPRTRRPRPVRPARRWKFTMRPGESELFPSGSHLWFRFERLLRVTSEFFTEISHAVKARIRSGPKPHGVRCSEPPDDSPRNPSIWPVLIFWVFLVAAPFAVYHWVGPVRRVVNATVGAVKSEINPPKKKSEYEQMENWLSEVPKTVLPGKNRGEVMALMLKWLRTRRPELSFVERMDELEILDHAVASDINRFIVEGSSEWKSRSYNEMDTKYPLVVRAACIAGDRARPCLVLALARDAGDFHGYTVVVAHEGYSYECTMLNSDPPDKRPRPVTECGEPWLKAVDFDLDGSDEVVATWQVSLKPFLHVQVHKQLDTVCWARVMSYQAAYLGQVSIKNQGSESMPQLVIADGIAPKDGSDSRQALGYTVFTYSWDKRAGTLKKVGQRVDHSELDPEDAGGTCVLTPKIVPVRIRSLLDKAFPQGWVCTAAKGIHGYQALTVYDDKNVADASSVWTLLVDSEPRICMAIEGSVYTDSNAVKLMDLDGDGRLEALFEINNGGMTNCTDYYICSFHPSFKLLAAVYSAWGDIQDIKDLDGDGKLEFVFLRECCEYFPEVTDDNMPHTPMVLGYRDGRYADVTREFPRIVRADMEDAVLGLRSALWRLRHNRDDEDFYCADATMAHSIRWLADAAVIGAERTAYAEIRRITSGELREWITARRTAILASVRSRRNISYEVPQIFTQ